VSAPGGGFAERYGPWALVAGGSNGIGECFARAIAERGVNIVLLARHESMLQRLAEDLQQSAGVEARVLVADLTAPDLEERVAAATADIEVGLLVYNAGAVHGVAAFHDRPVDQAVGLVALNCLGPVLLAHRFGGPMRARGRGGIVLLGSLISFAGSALVATYSATKAFDRILAEGLWRELRPHGVDVLGVVAGATRTPSMLASNELFASRGDLMDPDEVARGALAALGRGPIYVPGKGNRAAAHGMSPVSRVGLVNAMSRATAELYGLEDAAVDGVDFGDFGDLGEPPGA
jgi:short-subunit dehydrogenase